MIEGMNLGQFLDALEKVEPKDWIWIADTPVVMSPLGFDSYRGYYEDLAIAVDLGSGPMLAGGLLTKAKAALDETFTGYKGGNYRMGLDTRLWLSNYGESSGARVTGLRKIEGVSVWEITWRKAAR